MLVSCCLTCSYGKLCLTFRVEWFANADSLVNDLGVDAEPGEPGEAWLKGPVITTGYHNNAKANNAAFKDGWYRTGDLVELRGDLLYVMGRMKVSVENNHTSFATVH